MIEMKDTPELGQSKPKLINMAYYQGIHGVDTICETTLAILHEYLDAGDFKEHCECGEPMYATLMFTGKVCSCCKKSDFIIYLSCKQSPFFDRWANNKNPLICWIRSLFNKHQYELL